jgi:hypothetical protein
MPENQGSLAGHAVATFRPRSFTVFGQARLTVRGEAAGHLERTDAVQVLANAARFSAPRPGASSQAQSAPPVDLTQLAVAQTNAKMTAAAGAALGQATGELTGLLVNISA